jgi:HEAT repeat protein
LAKCARTSVLALINIGLKEEDNILVWTAFAAVGTIGSRKATRPLMHLVRTMKSSFKRQGVIFALGMLQDKRARSLLERVLADLREDSKTRGLAAEALGLLRPKEASVKFLIRALEDPSAEVRYSALCALGALRSRYALLAVKRMLEDHAIVDGDKTIAYYASVVTRDIEGECREQ